MDIRLFQAAKQGDTIELHAILEEDPLALHKISLLPYADTPLHIATLASKTIFANQILHQMPAFAWDCNKDGFTPLHIAAAIGNSDIVKEILKVSNEIGLIKDKGGRTPLHYAAIKGRVDVINELVSVCPEAVWEVTACGETALHLALINAQFEGFKALVTMISAKDFNELVNVVDDYGNTVLQLAHSTKHLQVLDFLRGYGITNTHHITEDSPYLTNLSPIRNTHHITITNDDHKLGAQSPPGSSIHEQQSVLEQQSKSLRRMVISKGVVPILAGILATSAYRQGLTPPPNIWNQQMRLDTTCFLDVFRSFSLTKSINKCPPATYYLFMSFNSAAFYCSIFLVFLHHVPGFLHALLPASLLSSVFSYLVFLLSMFPDAPTFLIVNSVAFLVFGFICLLKVVVKTVTNWTLTYMNKCN